MHYKRGCLLFSSLIIFSLLTIPAFSISVSYEAGTGGESVSVSEKYNLDTSTHLKADTRISAASAEITQSRTAKGEGDNTLVHTFSSTNVYSAENTVETAGTLDLSASYLASSEGMGLVQKVASTGDAVLLISGQLGKDTASQRFDQREGNLDTAQVLSLGSNIYLNQKTDFTGKEATTVGFASSGSNRVVVKSEVSEGSLKSEMRSGAAEGEISTSGDISIEGSGSFSTQSRDQNCLSSYEVSVMSSGGSADETLRGSLYAGAGSPKVTLGSASFTGDEVSLTSENTNLQGTYINTETRQDVTTTGKKTQASVLNYDLMSTGWTLEGLGVINYSETYTYDAGLGYVTNELVGYGDHYIQGAADTGADYVYMEQYLNNHNGSLDTFQQSVAYNHGECLLTNNDLHVNGSVEGYQWAGSDPTQVCSTQDLTISGDLIDNTYAVAVYSSLDYSMAGIKVDGAESVYVGTAARASNNIGGADGDPYHRTGATSDMIGYANSAEGWSCGRYLDQYSADAYGAWDVYGYGDLSLGAKTVKSAVADMELTTDSDQTRTFTFSRKDELPQSGLYNHAWNASDGEIDKFQTHLYAHAYPENDQHDMDEYASTGSLGISGSDATVELHRWNDSANDWAYMGGYMSVDPYTKVFRATDITTTAYNKEDFWEVDLAASHSPAERVPRGTKMMYNNSALTRTSGGRGIDVAIIDTGTDTLHPDLVMRIEDWANAAGPGEYGTSDSDPYGHGTHVAGIIVADGNFNGNGIWGMAPEADLHVYQTNLGYDDIAHAIYRSTDLGTDIISMSLGGPCMTTNLLNAIKYADANGVMLVAAAGNGLPRCTPYIAYPAAEELVIAVGAVDVNGDALWWTSPGYNDGDEIIESREVAFGAPGESICSTYPSYKGYYAYMSGTSMATPYIAGTAAKVWSENRCHGASADEIRAIMEGYAKQNDVVNVKITSNAKNYQSDVNDHRGHEYYDAIYPLLTSPGSYYLDILDGDDCLTGLGIPKLPAGTT